MSEFSLIYKKYDTVSGLTESLNKSVLTLKKRQAYNEPGVSERYPNLSVSKDELDYAKREIVKALFSLNQFIEERSTGNVLYELLDNELFRKQILADDHFKETLRQVIEKIKQDTTLSEEDFNMLDKFISILDNESTILFRKLRNQR